MTVSGGPAAGGPSASDLDDSRWGRARRWLRSHRWWFVGGAALVATGLGFLGFRSYLGVDARSAWDFLYLSLQLFVLESGSITGPAPLTLELARLLAPVVAAYAIWALVASVFRDELVGLRTNLWRGRGHVIVCGLEAGWALTRMARAQGEHVVVIERDEKHPRIETCRAQHIPVIVGDARDEQVLRKMGVRWAKRLFAVCGDDNVNMKVARQARRQAARRRSTRAPLQVIVHLADPYMCRLLRALEIRKESESPTEVQYFSVYDRGAKVLLDEYEAFPGGGSPPHMIVVGLGRLGRELAVNAARNRVIDRKKRPDAWSAPPTITVVDHRAEDKVAALKERHPFLRSACDLRVRETPPGCGGIAEGASALVAQSPDVSSAYVCLEGDTDALFVGLGLREVLDPRGVPVVVRVYDPDVPSMVLDAGDDAPAGLEVFSLFDRTCRTDVMEDLLELGMWGILAREIHGVYRREQEANGVAVPEWEELDDRGRDDNLRQAHDIKAKLVEVNCGLAPLTGPEEGSSPFAEAEIETLAELEHVQWVKGKEAKGWTHGPRKDAAAKEHPCLVPWDELPEEEKDKDRAFALALPSLLAAVGLRIVRTGSAQPVGAARDTVGVGRR